MTRRRFWLLVHRCNGLLLAGFLTVVGLTGGLLAWRLPLEHLFAPALFHLSQSIPNAQRVDPLRIREQLAVEFPQARVDMVDLTPAKDEPLEFQATLGPQAPPGTPDDIFVDPYTGVVLGSRHYGDLHEGAKNVVPFVYDIHQNLALGDAGELCLGVAALLWTFDCFVGLYLSFPASHGSVEPSWLTRALHWPRRMIPSWCIRWAAGGFRRLYDLHRAPGVWLWPMLLLFAWTGVAFNLPVVYGRVLRTAGAAQPATLPVCVAGEPRIQPDWHLALTTARSIMTNELLAHHATLDHERFLSYEPTRCAFTYRVRSSLDVDALGNTQIVWPADSPSNVVFSSTTATRADTFTIWLESIHEAQVGGLAVRLTVAATGLIVAMLSLTGVLIFLRKRGIQMPAPLRRED